MIGKGKGSQVAGHGRVLTGDRHMVAAGHYAAAHAGFLVLEAGGNAIDAGVAAGIALGVLQSDIVNIAGVAPIMIRLAESGEVVTIDGLGVWPEAASAAFFRREHGGRIPDGLLRTVTPAAPAAWIAALERFGTMSFEEVARYAGSDLLCYFADAPAELTARQQASWGPLLDWAADTLGLSLVRAAGVLHRPQPAETLAAVEALALRLDDYALTALAHASALLGSAVLALALERGRIGGEEAFDLSRLDEAFQEERWGVDAEAADRAMRLRAEAVTLEKWFSALRG